MVRDHMKKEGVDGSYDYTMMYYTNMESGGITILLREGHIYAEQDRRQNE